jgi:hypothetical protein
MGDGQVAIPPKARVGADIIRADGLPGVPRKAADALAPLDLEAGLHRRRGLRRVSEDEAPGIVDDGDPRALGLHKPAHRLDRRAKDGVQIRRRVERVRDLADRAGLALARRRVLLAGAGQCGGGSELLGNGVDLGHAVDSGRARSPRSTARAMPTSAPTAFAIRRPKMKARRPAMAAAAAAPASICQTRRRTGRRPPRRAP